MNIKIINILCVVAVYVYRLVRGSAHIPSQSPKRFVVINATGNIGDMVCTTPVFRAIKHAQPDAHITVIGSPKNEAMLQGNTDIDAYIRLDTSFWNIIQKLRATTADVGVMINPSAVDFALLFLGGVRAISFFRMSAAFRAVESRAYRAVARFGIPTEYTPGKYVPRQYISLLKPFGMDSDDIRKHLGYTSAGESTVINSLKEKHIHPQENIVAIAPGAGTKIKQWPAERFGKIAEYVSDTYGLPVVIIGGPRDIPEVEQMKSVFTDTVRYCDFTNQSLDELKATLSKVKLIIGNDSGPIYIAEAFGAGAIVLVGPTDELEHPLQDATHRVVIAREKGGALLRSGLSAEDSIDLGEARSQINAITVEEVCTHIDDLCKELAIERVS